MIGRRTNKELGSSRQKLCNPIFSVEKGNKQVGPDKKYEPIYNLNKNMCSRYFEASIPAVSSRGNTIQGTDCLLWPEF